MHKSLSPGHALPDDVNPSSLILLVDDDEDQRSLFKAVLERQGDTVVTAGSANEARALLKEIHVDLVVCDVNMPGTNALELIPSLRKASGLSGLPIVSFTADAYRSSEDLLKCGANLHCSKSQVRSLVQGVKELLTTNSPSKQRLLERIQDRFHEDGTPKEDAPNHEV